MCGGEEWRTFSLDDVDDDKDELDDEPTEVDEILCASTSAYDSDGTVAEELIRLCTYVVPTKSSESPRVDKLVEREGEGDHEVL